MVPTVRRLVGVYDADGTILGELSYLVRARLGRAHCALCDVTHGRVRERADWRAARAGLPVPFVAYHRDDQPAAVRAAGGSRPPAVVAELAGGEVVAVLDAEAIERCAGEPEQLVSAVVAAVDAAGLRWPDPLA
jgi:hypothetical protein